MSDKELKLTRSEIKLHRSLDHPHILKIINSFEDDLFLQIILEKCSQSNFMDLLKQNKYFLIEDAKTYILQLVDALK